MDPIAKILQHFYHCLNYAISFTLFQLKLQLCLAYCVIIHMIFISFRICKTFRAFKITFLKLKENQQLVNTPDFTLNYFLKLQRLES